MARKLDLPTPRSNDLFKLKDGSDATIKIFSMEEKLVHPVRIGKYPECTGEDCKLCRLGGQPKAWYYADAEVNGRRTTWSLGPMLYKQTYSYLAEQEDQEAPFKVRQSGRELSARWLIVPADGATAVDAVTDTKLDTSAEVNAEVDSVTDTDTDTSRAVGTPAQEIPVNDPFGTVLLGSLSWPKGRVRSGRRFPNGGPGSSG